MTTSRSPKAQSRGLSHPRSRVRRRGLVSDRRGQPADSRLSQCRLQLGWASLPLGSGLWKDSSSVLGVHSKRRVTYEMFQGRPGGSGAEKYPVRENRGLRVPRSGVLGIGETGGAYTSVSSRLLPESVLVYDEVFTRAVLVLFTSSTGEAQGKEIP